MGCNMAKIINLDDKKKTLVNWLKEILDMAEKGEIKDIVLACFREDETKQKPEKEVLTGYFNLDFSEKQYLVAHLQMDLNYKMIESNIDKLIEIINN